MYKFEHEGKEKEQQHLNVKIMLSCIHYRSHGNAATFKPEIFRYWQRPNLLPEDLFDLTFGGTDYAWVIVGDPFTGTLPHVDPDMTAAWNLLVHGRKVI